MRPDPSADATRVLLVSALQIFPPRSGGHLRSSGLARALASHGLDVFVYSMVGRKEDYLARRASGTHRGAEGVVEYVDRGLLGFVLQYGTYALEWPPLWIPAYLRVTAASPRGILLPAVLRRKLSWCDVVIADFPYVYPVFAASHARGRLRILSTHNIEHHFRHDRSLLRNRFRQAVRRMELHAAEECDILVTCSAGDKDFFERHVEVRRSILVPSGIDARRFQGIEAHRDDTRRALGIADDVTVFLFVASRWGPNAEAFSDVLEFVRTNVELLAADRIHIVVVGSVSAELRIPGLTATGQVDSVEPYLAAADAALNPTRSGGGTNLKMCEYMAARLPIVTTAFGTRGFRIEDGRTGFVYEPDDLAQTLARVRRLRAEDPGRLRRMAEAAYADNEAEIDMEASARPLVRAILDHLRSSERQGGAAP